MRFSRPPSWPQFRYWAAAAAALGLALAACGPTGQYPNGRPAAPLTDPVVAATVNGKPIYIDDVLAEAVARGAIKEGEDLPSSSPVFYQVMEDLIETRLMANEAEARGLDKNGDVRHRLDSARERILANVLNENIAATALRDSAIERMYREQVRLLKQGREVRARHILFDTKEAALAAKRRLDNGELFEALAYELSKDRASATDGGDLGYFLPEAMPDALREERRARFMSVAEQVSAEKLRSRIGANMQVLVDSAPGMGKKGGVGRSYADAPEIDGVVRLLPPEKISKTLKVGEFTRARIVDTDGHDLVAVPV